MKYLFVISSYPPYQQQIFDDIISSRNKQYCGKHDFKYVEIRKEHNIIPFRGNLTWNKWKVIQDLIKSGTLKNDDIIIQQDADVINYDIDATYEPDEGKSMSICIDSGNTFCHGIFGLRINDWSKKLVDNILDVEISHRLHNKPTIHEGFPNNPPTTFISQFREQAVFYNLFGIKRHSWIPFNELPNNGIGSDITEETIYDVSVAEQHLQILPVEYNVTIWPEDTPDTTFYINKLEDKSKVKFRHFTGSNWKIAYNWTLNTTTQ